MLSHWVKLCCCGLLVGLLDGRDGVVDTVLAAGWPDDALCT